MNKARAALIHPSFPHPSPLVPEMSDALLTRRAHCTVSVPLRNVSV